MSKYLIDKEKILDAVRMTININPDIATLSPTNIFIGNLLSFIDELPNEAEWISCKDLIPDHSSSVLVFAKGHRVSAYYDCHKNRFRLSENENLYYDAEDVTHWLPMPDCPDCF